MLCCVFFSSRAVPGGMDVWGRRQQPTPPALLDQAALVRILCDGGGGGRLQRTHQPALLRCNYLFSLAWPLEAPLFATLNRVPKCTILCHSLCHSSASPLFDSRRGIPSPVPYPIKRRFIFSKCCIGELQLLR